jgi:4'-phosphopantetheinyl transferase
MKIYALNIYQNISLPLFNRLLSFVSDERRKKINKFIRKEDSDRALAADILLREALIENFKIQNEDILFYYNAYGKPYLMHTPSIYFNISHSGNWVVCAIDDYEVGIDVEKIENIDLDIAKSFFSKKEYMDLMKKVPAKKKEYFYDLWTLKESYIKACGKGLSLDLRSFSIGIEKNNIILETKSDFKNYFFNQYNIDKNYKLSVCTLEGTFPEEVTFKTLENLNINC